MSRFLNLRTGRIAAPFVLSLSLLSSPAQAILPNTVPGMGDVPSLAPMLERVLPAVVSISSPNSDASSDPQQFYRRYFDGNDQRSTTPNNGTETLGSIVSPCMRCGTTGLRPTFGRVARTGAMALCWSLDKIGPIARTVEDCMLVLDAINGADAGDPSSLDMPLNFDARASGGGLVLGYDPAWFEGEQADDLDRAALDAARRAGLQLTRIELPDWPYETLLTILTAEAASACEELTLSNRDDELVWQEPQAWPNTFRQTRFTPAIEYIQAQRFRRMVMEMMAERFEDIDAIISPSYAGALLLITNCTGHPSLTIRCGLKEDGRPHCITLWGRLFDEGTLCNIGMALEGELDVWHRRPGSM